MGNKIKAWELGFEYSRNNLSKIIFISICNKSARCNVANDILSWPVLVPWFNNSYYHKITEAKFVPQSRIVRWGGVVFNFGAYTRVTTCLKYFSLNVIWWIAYGRLVFCHTRGELGSTFRILPARRRNALIFWIYFVCLVQPPANFRMVLQFQ